MTVSQQVLKGHILGLSQATDFAVACTEWSLVNIYVTDDFDSCPCGHEIKEHCEIANRFTRSETFVGNVCIKRFMNLDTGTLFAGLKRICACNTANANAALIAYAETRGFLFPNEALFLRSTARKRSPSAKQLAWKEKINRRIIKEIVVRKLPRP